ncbi:hypothetical protein SB6413_04551 [Klebsiella pasteurii]|nr:hypothetical protein SB6413_04551 [Klebsiella pasteurii]
MKITLFGATGKLGAHLIREGLARGDKLTVFARQQLCIPRIHYGLWAVKHPFWS